jgi:hypothetical protein
MLVFCSLAIKSAAAQAAAFPALSPVLFDTGETPTVPTLQTGNQTRLKDFIFTCQNASFPLRRLSQVFLL